MSLTSNDVQIIGELLDKNNLVLMSKIRTEVGKMIELNSNALRAELTKKIESEIKASEARITDRFEYQLKETEAMIVGGLIQETDKKFEQINKRLAVLEGE